ncbi:MAG: hypothetical protein J6M05_04145 [Cardiobacteriaceae bacterium]|nr:hypothetical protein [Cardiobacteriaceae bacterium]
MKEIYLLTHHRKYEDGSGSDIKLLGTYSSLEEIEKVLPHYRKQPGFCDYPDDFVIEKYELDEQTDWNEGFILGKNIPSWASEEVAKQNETAEEFALRLYKEQYGKEPIRLSYSEFAALLEYAKKKKTYVLWHSYQNKHGKELTKCLGIYSNLELAEEAKARYATLPGFCDIPEGLYIDEFLINRNK